MKAATLTIGDELTCGYRLDTNSQAISRRLTLLPAEVVLHMTVNDTPEAIQEGLCTTLDAADVVVITGGLGPTEDDLTRQVIAAHFGVELVEDAEALARIKERFARFGRTTMPETNRIQAQAPAGSQIIYNDRGTAAGFYLPVDEKHIFVTPGIPYEMEGMLEAFILPRLQELAGADHHVRRAALKVYGLPESGINERIRPMMARGRNPLLGLLPHRGTITIEIVAAGSTPEEAERLMEAEKDCTGWIVTEESACDARTTRRLLKQNKERVDAADALLILSCGAGVQTVAALVDTPVYPALNTLFLARIQNLSVCDERCRLCGQCILAETAALCPVTLCPKGLMNGPCGGYEDGKCEVDRERDCAWVAIYERMEELGQRERFLAIHEPKDWRGDHHPGFINKRAQKAEAKALG